MIVWPGRLVSRKAYENAVFWCNYLVWLVITPWITTTPLDGSAIWFDFFITFFKDILREKIKKSPEL